MNMHYGWIVKSVIIGLIVMLAVYYLFSIAFSINEREYKMMNKLSQYNDTTFEYLRGSGDINLLAAMGALIALFAGGMAATLLSRIEKPFIYEWLVPSAIAAISVMLAIDAYMVVTWSHTLEMARTGVYGRPVDTAPFFVILFIMLVFDAVCFLASAAGGLVVAISKNNKN